MYGKNDLVLYDCYMKELADSLNANSDGITVSSKINVMLRKVMKRQHKIPKMHTGIEEMLDLKGYRQMVAIID